MFLVRFFSKPSTLGRNLAGAFVVSIYLVRNKVTRAERKEENDKAIAAQAAKKEAKALATKNSLDFDQMMEEIRRVEREANKQRAAEEKKAKADEKKKMVEEYAEKMEKKRDKKSQKERERREKEEEAPGETTVIPAAVTDTP